MRPRKKLSSANRDELFAILRQSASAEEFRRIQCVWLRASMDLPVAQIALATGLSPASIRCYQSRYLRHGANALKSRGRGGRHHQNLSLEQEHQLLQPFFKAAAEGAVLEAGRVRIAYQQIAGRDVPLSTVYRLLARHGWRKAARPGRHANTETDRPGEFERTFPPSA